MKKLTWISFLLCLILASCKEYNEVRIMPEFNNSETEVTLYKNIGSSATVVINTTADDITAEYDADWLSVDVNKRRVIYTITAANETGEPRIALVKLYSGEWMQEITVTQRELEESEIKLLKVGDLTEDGLGMIFWVDPENPEVGKAISLQRRVGACELPYKMNGAFFTVNGIENTALFASPSPNDAVVFCTSIGEGWYMPASEELAELFDAYNGIAHDDPAFVANNAEAITDTEKSARAKFEKMLADLGGDPINSAATGAGESYWSSTEVSTVADGKNAIYVRFGKYLSQGGSKEGSTRYARAMKLVGNYKFPEEPATLKVSPSKVDLASEEGASKEVTVTTNKDTYTYIVEGEDITWIKAEQNEDIVTFTALSANTSDKERSVTVTFTTGSEDNQATVEVIVTQEKMPVASAFTIGEYVDMDKGVQLAEGGIVFWAEGNEAKILALKRIEQPLSWVSDESVKSTAVGCTDRNDGAVNTEMMTLCGFADKIPVLNYCHDGWYVPAIEEMNDVFIAYNGGPASAPGLKPDAITDTEKSAREAWDKLFTDRGGDVMNSNLTTIDVYWTSTESADPSKAFFIRLGQWEADKTGSKYQSKPTRYWRLVRKVSK